MWNEQVIDSVVMDGLNLVQDSVGQVKDSVMYPESLYEESVSRMPHPPYDTLTQYIGLVKGEPLTSEKMDIHFISGVLIYTMVFLIFLAFIRLRGRGFISSVYLYFFDKKKRGDLLSDSIRQNYFFVFLSVCLSFSCFAMLLAFFVSTPFSFFYALFFFLAILTCYIVLISLIGLFGWTFNGKDCASDIILSMRASAIVLGFSISPFVLALFFVQPVAVNSLLYVIVGVFVIFLIFRFIRLIKILYGYRVSILYIILYLCGLEILPILILYKLIGMSSGS